MPVTLAVPAGLRLESPASVRLEAIGHGASRSVSWTVQASAAGPAVADWEITWCLEHGISFFVYCWPVAGDPAPEQAIAAQERFWQHRLDNVAVLPEVLTLSMGWDSTPWHPPDSRWHLPPAAFQTLCRRARSVMARFPQGTLSQRVVLLDKWNEFGEGHDLAPHRQYGFGYLDAVRAAFTSAPSAHVDLTPEDVGLGPYDRLYHRHREEDARCRRVVQAPGAVLPGLVAWWTFDDEDESVALDGAGHGLGGLVKGAARSAGRRGQALVCAGGCVTIPPDPRLTPRRAMTLAAWVRTDVPGQSDKWFANSILGDGTAGFRMGLSGGRPTFALPLSRWSHHLTAQEPLPTGRWVHVAGTYDGEAMRLYLEGREVGSGARQGPVRANCSGLFLGSFSLDHAAHFSGALDEVCLHDRALSAAEIAAQAAATP